MKALRIALCPSFCSAASAGATVLLIPALVMSMASGAFRGRNLYSRFIARWTSAMLVALLGIAATAKAASTAYVVNHTGQFGIVDLSSGAITDIGSSGVPYQDLALSPSGTLYGSASAGTIYSVNPSTGAATAIGNGAPDTSLAIKFDPAGRLYAATPAVDIYTANSPSGSFSLVGSAGVSTTWFDLAFTGPNSLVLEANPGGADSSLYNIDTSTGDASLIGPTGYTVATLVFEDGTLYGFTVGTDQIVSIDTSTGQGSPITSFDSSFGTIFGAAETVYTVTGPVTTSVPLPPAVWPALALLAAVGCVGAVRRARAT